MKAVANEYARRTRNPQEALALWLATNQPEVFKALVRDANRAGRLHGVTDWLSGVGTSLGTAVQNVGSFLSSQEGMQTLTNLGNTYLQVKAQRDALRLQTRMAQSGYAPAPIESVGPNPYTSVPVYVDSMTGARVPFDSRLSRQLQPTNWVPIAIIGGLFAVVFWLHAKNR